MNAADLDGPLLNYWVAQSEGLELMEQEPEEGEPHSPDTGMWHPKNYHPASDWSHGGPIVSREWSAIEAWLTARFSARWPFVKVVSDAPLAWFMRAYVATKFGDEVEDLG